jgi:hypothetical protein
MVCLLLLYFENHIEANALLIGCVVGVGWVRLSLKQSSIFGCAQ